MDHLAPQLFGVFQNELFDAELFEGVEGLAGDQHVDGSASPHQLISDVGGLLEDGDGLTPPAEVEGPEDSHQASPAYYVLVLLLCFVDHLVLYHQELFTYSILTPSHP